MGKHGGLQEIIDTGQPPMGFVRGASRDEGHIPSSSTYYDRALGEVVPTRGRARREFLKSRGIMEAGDFHEPREMKKELNKRERKGVPRESVAAAVAEARQQLGISKPWSQLVKEHVKKNDKRDIVLGDGEFKKHT